jgi:hypothetical protein
MFAGKCSWAASRRKHQPFSLFQRDYAGVLDHEKGEPRVSLPGVDLASYFAGIVVVVIVVDVEFGGALILPLLWPGAGSFNPSPAWPLVRPFPCSLVCAAASPCLPPTLISPGTLISPVVNADFILTVYWT